MDGPFTLEIFQVFHLIFYTTSQFITQERGGFIVADSPVRCMYFQFYLLWHI